jgi:hypothetical protein
VFRIRASRLGGVAISGVMAFLLLSVGTATAKTPGWVFTDGFTATPVTTASPFTGSPRTVSPGANVAYDVVISNTGKSNISLLYLSTDIPASSPSSSPVYISAVQYSDVGPANPCNAAGSGPLLCNFGNLISGAHLELTVAFRTPLTGTSWSFNFTSFGNGNTPSDGGTSHGDTLKGPASVTLDGTANFAGGYVVDAGQSFATSPLLTKKNPQSTTVGAPGTLIPVTVREGTSYPGDLTDPCAGNCVGEWADLNVNGGAAFSGGFKVVLTILGSNVPGRVKPNQLFLYHDGDGIIGDSAAEQCTSATAPAVMPCITVTKVGTNYQIVAWLLHNGGLRGAY